MRRPCGGRRSGVGLVRLVAAIFLAGCVNEKRHPSESTPSDDVVAVDLGGPDAPEMTVDDAVARLGTAMETGLPNPIDIRDAYVDVLSLAERGCPIRENPDATDANGVWFDDCVTAAGTHFDGQANFDESASEGAWAFEGVANFVVTYPTGRVFSGGGEFAEWGEKTGTSRQWTSKTGGNYHLSDAAGWLGESGQAGFYVDASVDADGAVVQLDGGVGYDDVDLAFEAMISDAAVCDAMPSGRVLIRDDTGFWFDVRLDGCDGCGRVVWRDLDLGERCPGPAIRDAIVSLAAVQTW